MTVQREKKEDENWGYSIGTSLGNESISLSPTIMYKLRDDIDFSCQLTIDS